MVKKELPLTSSHKSKPVLFLNRVSNKYRIEAEAQGLTMIFLPVLGYVVEIISDDGPNNLSCRVRVTVGNQPVTI